VNKKDRQEFKKQLQILHDETRKIRDDVKAELNDMLNRIYNLMVLYSVGGE
jgi:hypothetical protein